MIIKNIKGEYHYHSKGTSKELPTRDFCKPLNDCGDNFGGIKSIRVMSIEEATRIGILNDAQQVIDELEDGEEFGVKSINTVDNPLPGFEFAVVNDKPDLKLLSYD